MKTDLTNPHSLSLSLFLSFCSRLFATHNGSLTPENEMSPLKIIFFFFSFLFLQAQMVTVKALKIVRM